MYELWYKNTYEESIQTIKEANKELTLKEYTKIAKEKLLLNASTLQAISKMDFKKLVKYIRKE